MFFRIFSGSLLLLILISTISVFSVVKAQEGSVQMLNLELKNVTVQGGTVSGSVRLVNNSSKNYAEAYLVTTLNSLGGTTTLKSGGQDITIQNEGQLVGFSKSEPFSVKPNDNFEKTFTVSYPTSVKPGKYLLAVEVHDPAGNSQGVASSDVELSGTNTFLEINSLNCSIKIGSKSFNAFEGPNLGKGETGTLTCQVKNSTGQSVQATPQISYAVDSVVENATNLKTENLSPKVSIAAGQTRSISVGLPSDLTSQVYEGMFALVNDQNEKISPSIPFRWIITGASATITNLDLDKSYYKAGETAKVSVTALQSADLSWRSGVTSSNPGYSPDAGTDIKNPKLLLKITNSDNNVCGEKEQVLPSTANTSDWNLQVDIPVTAECKNPSVQASIYEEGSSQPLATLTEGAVTTQDDLEEAAPKLEIKGETLSRNMWILGLVLILLVAGGAGGYLYWKKKKGPPGSPPQSPQPPSVKPPQPPVAATATVIAALMFTAFAGMNLQKTDFLSASAQTTGPIQGTAKPFSNSTDENTKTVTQIKYHDRRNPGGGLQVNQWANVRDFSQNNTGGDSSVEVDRACKTIKITVNGTAGSSYYCGNWGPGIAIANFVDGAPITPTEISSRLGNQVMIPSLQVAPGAFNDFSQYGPHIVNVSELGRGGQKSITYTLKLPTGMTEGRHKLILQAGPSQATFHGAFDRYYSSLERIIDGPQFLPGDVNCDGKTPCFTNLEKDFSCGPPPACNQSCGEDFDCEGALNGCTKCRPNPEGQKVCQPPPPACDAACASDRDCFGGLNGCTACVAGQCRIPPACGVSCSRDDQCAGARDGCTACVSGVCKVPPACGVACTTKADCTGARDGCTECLEGTCTNYNDQMCKCDGMIADIAYPSTSFNFEAFGKVEGTDIKKAEIADITFRMTKDNQVVAKSNPITPSIVENTASKVRFKAAWSTPPPPIDRNSVYRVFADVRCKPKRIVASNTDTFSTEPKAIAEQKLYPPKGLEWLVKNIAKLFGGEVNPFVSEVLAQLSSPSPSPSVAQTNLQLQTLNFVKLMDTDNCRFVMFKFDETLF